VVNKGGRAVKVAKVSPIRISYYVCGIVALDGLPYRLWGVENMTKTERVSPNPIVLRRSDSVGAADAESDREFLKRCFVDSGQIEELLDCNDSKSLILGRTGSGKTALLLEVKRRVENAVELAPEDLSLNFLINSSVLNFFEEAGVHLDVFYKLLWQHVFCVELIKAKYKINNEEKQAAFWNLIPEVFNHDRSKEEALRYLESGVPIFGRKRPVELRNSRITSRLNSVPTRNWMLISLSSAQRALRSFRKKRRWRCKITGSASSTACISATLTISSGSCATTFLMISSSPSISSSTG
jgi:hypothetical protein